MDGKGDSFSLAAAHGHVLHRGKCEGACLSFVTRQTRVREKVVVNATRVQSIA